MLGKALSLLPFHLTEACMALVHSYHLALPDTGPGAGLVLRSLQPIPPPAWEISYRSPTLALSTFQSVPKQTLSLPTLLPTLSRTCLSCTGHAGPPSLPHNPYTRNTCPGHPQATISPHLADTCQAPSFSPSSHHTFCPQESSTIALISSP